jgi:hypothetical protein
LLTEIKAALIARCADFWVPRSESINLAIAQRVDHLRPARSKSDKFHPCRKTGCGASKIDLKGSFIILHCDFEPHMPAQMVNSSQCKVRL